MKRIVIYSLLTLFIYANFACTQVGTNNKVANGDVVATDVNSETDVPIDEAPDITIQPDNSNVPKDSQPPPKSPNSPEAIVEDLYTEADKDNNPFFQNTDRPLINTYFTKDLADMIWKDAVETKDDEEGKIDFDPLYDAQDAEVADLKIGKSKIKDEKATVTVTFLNFGEPHSITYLLKKENSQWKIEDINYEESSLAKILRAEKPITKTTTEE